MTAFSVRIRNRDKAIACRADQTVLASAIAAGLDYPYACASGNCAICISALHAGEVTMLAYGDGALSVAQRAAGRVLACRARPLRDVEGEWPGRR